MRVEFPLQTAIALPEDVARLCFDPVWLGFESQEAPPPPPIFPLDFPILSRDPFVQKTIRISGETAGF